MTLDEADTAVAAAMEHRDDVIMVLVDNYTDDKLSEVISSLDDLVEAEVKLMEALDIWGALDDAEKGVTHAV